MDLMFVGFMGVCGDQIFNNAAKIHYMFGGKVKLPLTIMTGIGARHQLGGPSIRNRSTPFSPTSRASSASCPQTPIP